MKLTLISPYSSIEVLGIRILSAVLKRKGHSVQIIFLQRNFWDRYEDNILNDVVELSKGSGLIGISLMTNFFDNAVQVTQKLKGNLNIPVIWGGIHPTLRPEECLDYADMVCVGEGEEALVESAEKMESGESLYNVQGIWFKDKERIVKNNLRPLIQDLNSLPFPDYDYENQYILNNGCIQKMDKELLKKHTLGNYVTMATRGCPFGCTYCCNNALNEMYPDQKSVRKRSTDNIIEELTDIKDRLPFMENIVFEDDQFFFFTEGEIKQFCAKYKQNIGLPFIVGGAHPSTLTGEKLSLLVDAGLMCIRMGIQTGSDRTKRLYKRHYSNRQAERAVRMINGYKDKIKLPQYDIIVDNPWETDEDLIDTLMLLAKLPTPYSRMALT